MAVHPIAQPIDLTILETQLHVKRGLALTALSGIVHAYGGQYFDFLPPLGGFCYGAALAINIWAIHAIFRIANININRGAGSWMARYLLCVYGAPAIAALITTAVGFPIDYNKGMAVGVLSTYLVVEAAFYAAIAAFALVSVIACVVVMHRMRRDQVTAEQAIAGLYNDLRPRLPDGIRIALDNIRQRFRDIEPQPA